MSYRQTDKFMKQATKLNQVMLLIKSLSKAEKRYIRLYTNLQNGDKHYMVLYDLACEGFSAEQIYEKFCGKVNEKSFEIAAKHLYRVLLDCLVQLREKQDIQTTIFIYITKAGILFERELFDNALAEVEEGGRHIRKRSTPPSDLPYGIEISKHTRFRRHQRERTGRQTNAD